MSRPDLTERTAQTIFELVARVALYQRTRLLSFAQATICWLLVKQMKRVDADAARDVCRALAYECSNGDMGGWPSFETARARLAEIEAERLP